jgi:hypothetical protein
MLLSDVVDSEDDMRLLECIRCPEREVAPST